MLIDITKILSEEDDDATLERPDALLVASFDNILATKNNISNSVCIIIPHHSQSFINEISLQYNLK